MVRGDLQPLVGGAVEAQSSGFKSELSVASRDSLTLVVLGHETETGLANHRFIERIGTGGRLKPTSARDEAGTGIVDNQHGQGAAPNVSGIIGRRKSHGINVHTRGAHGSRRLSDHRICVAVVTGSTGRNLREAEAI